MRAAPARVQTHPPTPASPQQPSFAPQPERQPPAPREPRRQRVAPSESSAGPTQAPAAQTPQPQTQPQTPPQSQAQAPSVEEVENDPLVKTVLDVFGGEIKRVHPKNA